MLFLVFCFAFVTCVVSTPSIKSLNEIRIVGGKDVEITEAPYQVSLLLKGRLLCGGAIVARDIIITAAHCVVGTKPDKYQVRVGSSYSENGGQVHQVGDILWHPRFTNYDMDFDVALLWLRKPLEFNDRVAPIEMIKEGEEIKDGDTTIVTGWGNIMEGGGIPTMLQMVTVPKVNENYCNDVYMPAYRITSRMFCAGVPEGGKDACQGDSGGPLVHNKKLAGIVSWGLGCARPDFPGVYSKVSALRRWIDNHIAILRMKHIYSRPAKIIFEDNDVNKTT